MKIIFVKDLNIREGLERVLKEKLAPQEVIVIATTEQEKSMEIYDL